MPTTAAIDAYRAALTRWFGKNARDLPWRRQPDPYRVWVSEIMLQQTRVETVIPYFERFVRRLPNLAALAGASEEEVLELWSGLGYYRRARMLHAGALVVCDQHGGVFPRDGKEVRALPGIGRYTAGAILSIALGVRAPILDGNVIRVLCRVFALRGNPTRQPLSGMLWDLAAQVVERGKPAVVNQAQMELGALVCTPRDPDCAHCPVKSQCAVASTGEWTELPQLPPRRTAVAVHCTALLVRYGRHVLLRRRLADELLAGLWDLPGSFTGRDGDRSSGVREALSLLPFSVTLGETLGPLRHAVTHRRIELTVCEAYLRSAGTTRPPVGEDWAWVEPAEAEGWPLSAPARRILERWGAALSARS